MLLITEK